MGIARNPVHRATAPRSRAGFRRIFPSFGNSFAKVAHVAAFFDAVLRPLSVILLRKVGHDMAPKVGVTQLQATLRLCRSTLVTLGVFSGISNILMLTGSFFMLEIYDRVLPSRNIATLIGLSILALMLFAFQGAIDIIRGRINARVGRFIDAALSRQVYAAIIQMPLKTRGDGDGMQPLRDLDQLRSFLSGWGPSAFFDLPWMPLYLILCFLFHFWIGISALIGSMVLVTVALMTEFKTQEPTKVAAGFARTRTSLATAGRRNAEVLHAMGMSSRAAAIWSASNRDYLLAHERASDVATSLGGFSKVFRMMLQSAVLAVGAVLVIHQEATAGIIIASSILTSRALAPVELAIANWKGFVAARQSAGRLNKLLTLFPEQEEPLPLPPPKTLISVQAIGVMPPGEQRLVVNNISFELRAGQALGIIGPSGSGKTSLARALVGVWQPVRGRVCLDDAALEHWCEEARGRHIGYLPQDVELFEGSIAENICRFERNADPKAILDAAVATDVHKLILSLHGGYGTRIGEGGMALSAGQRQRIGLARALYGDPFIIVLDEPSSNLDAEGEEALTQAILAVRGRGGIAIIIAHRPSALAAVDQVLVMENGSASMLGKKEDVLNAVMRPVPLPATTPRVTAQAARSSR
jgi:ATP-binding cassette, subfamily C, type I secretion system permease/ATPase